MRQDLFKETLGPKMKEKLDKLFFGESDIKYVYKCLLT